MIKGAIIFTCGCVVGAAIAVPITMRKIVKREQKRADEKIAANDAYIHELEERLKIHESAIGNGENKPLSNEEEIAEKRPDIEIKRQHRLEGTEILRPPIRDYTSYYQERAESEYPREDEGGEEVKDSIEETVDLENQRMHESMTSGKRPKIISYEEYWSTEYEFHDKVELNYFTEDEVLASKEDEEIENVHDLIGNALTKYGFATNDELVIYVRNYEMARDFEIYKVFGAYADTI